MKKIYFLTSCPYLDLLLQERQPLLPHGIKLDAGLEEQVESMVASANAGEMDDDLIAAQNKV